MYLNKNVISDERHLKNIKCQHVLRYEECDSCVILLQDIQDKAKQKLATNKTVNRTSVSQTRRAVLPSRPKKEDPKSKAPIKSIGSKPVKLSVVGKPERKPMLMKAIPNDKTLTRQAVAEESKISEESRAMSPSTPRRSTMRKSSTPAPVKKISLPPSTVTPDAKKMELRTPISKPTSTRKTPRSRLNKRAAPDDEDLVTDDESFSLGCTPSGKVRCVEDGKPLPVIRKSFEILRLKTTEVSRKKSLEPFENHSIFSGVHAFRSIRF